MKTYEQAINDHYSRDNLTDSIQSALDRSGHVVSSHEDTAGFDEFHIRGREATRELADLAGLEKGMTVLDLGCGIGGPARTLAAEYGCIVTGIDLVAEYCRAAEMLTAKVGLSERVRFQHGDMTALPFDPETFDVVWTLHTTMNIENKAALFSGVARVLRPGGLLALYEVCSGDVKPPYYPVPWASDGTIDFLVPSDVLKRLISVSGFTEVAWRDVSTASLDWLRRTIDAKKTAAAAGAPRTVGLGVVMGKTAAQKSGNMVRNLDEDRIRIFQGVFRRAS
ncbi:MULTISPECIES: SAM-dependent methyltransferase [Desulfococcus]|uniref:Methyltransferase type 11 n=1 Tax=Desulfococcus multivorans DSM 2059 TaxID=1121405 RepID=S7V9E4_DESML|nr:class I SAM-dependent methyltransferase [Desulfococcus multivorans]AOY58520.1 methyltransferase, type 11 [Desulfococcus multivorans]AQV02950.1 SAM-dependent methyltransferase [Desulfococcus multivorans]EPR43304.1 Methyltransferase type 11 [Desulfococcus multivorans DSM 2059]MDX9818795.1 methyltransferase domain-containing protein [Desulfococcus multivorans]SJZ42403.1 Cyclopropane fatty-acyl-phospholipid synthase [Desulfococcus multivorans DSM 2059]